MLLALAATIGLMVVNPPAADSADELVAAEASYGLRVRRGLAAAFVVTAVVCSASSSSPSARGCPCRTGLAHPHAVAHLDLSGQHGR